MAVSYPAKFPDTCVKCKNDIAVGAQIVRSEEGYRHVRCPLQGRGSCPNCFLRYSLDGSCGCYE